MPPVTVTLIGKPGCHLCDVARAVIDAVLAERAEAELGSIELVERSIVDEPALHERYSNEIPVVLIDDEVHTIYRVDAERLRAALAGRGS